MAKRLRRLRHGKSLSLARAAAEIGVPESTYRDWEYGRETRGEPYLRIAEVFGVSLHTLLTGDLSADGHRKEQYLKRIEDVYFPVQAPQ